jgi:DNA ligase-1
MKTVYDTLMLVRATSSTKEKLAILARESSEQLQQFLRVTYDPRVNFYLKKVQPEFGVGYLQDIQFNSELINNIVMSIAGRKVTGNAARNYLASVYHDLTTDWEKELLTLMIQRDVKCGISEGSINKVWPGLVTVLAYMRISLPKAVKLAEWPWADGIYSQIKADGQFINASNPYLGEVSLETRNGSPYPLEFFKDLVAEIKAKVPKGMQLHGELLMMRDGKILPRQIGNGMFNSMLQGGELDAGCTPIFDAWDIIPLTEAKAKNKYKVQYKTRFAELKSLNFGVSAIRLIECKMVYSYAEAKMHARDVMLQGLEGTVIKHPEGIWEDSDSGSKFQVKLKLEFDIELKIVGFNPADDKSKNSDTFGSLQCESSDGLLKVGVTGIKDDVRKQMWDDRELILSRAQVVTVRANGIMFPSEDGDDHSLFLPRYIETRLEKNTADSMEQIIKIQESTIDAGIE